ncbi:hypothetical protein AYI96_14905 [Shewanella sp. MSW]|nr:hypothetical protein AYI96_14905 [Shewanella sp. MSW]
MFVNVIKKISKFRTYEHISLHGTAKDYLYFGPIILLLKIFFKKKYSLRKFAGNFDEFYASLNFINRYLIRLLLRCSSVNFFETLSLVDAFKKFNVETYWFPNVRPLQEVRSIPYINGEKFKVLYFSQISNEKGILDLIEAVKPLDNVLLTIAGPISDKNLKNFESLCSNNVEYVGMIGNSEVYNFISNHHCFVLPTFYPGEGYPGAILEAFMVGLPVISTNWRQIPELVGQHGILVEPRSITQLRSAIVRVMSNHCHFKQLSIERASAFEDSKNTNMFLSKINITSNYED